MAKNKHGHYITRTISYFKRFAGYTDFDDSESKDSTIIATRREHEGTHEHGHVDREPGHEVVEEDEHEPNRRSVRGARTRTRRSQSVLGIPSHQA